MWAGEEAGQRARELVLLYPSTLCPMPRTLNPTSTLCHMPRTLNPTA